jgi:hypothetical protein
MEQNTDTTAYPLLSLVQGRDDTSVDLAQGSFKYVSLRCLSIAYSIHFSFSYAYVAGMAEPGCLCHFLPCSIVSLY